MKVTASLAAITRAADADHSIQWHRMRAAIYITPYGLEYRSTP